MLMTTSCASFPVTCLPLTNLPLASWGSSNFIELFLIVIQILKSLSADVVLITATNLIRIRKKIKVMTEMRMRLMRIEVLMTGKM